MSPSGSARKRAALTWSAPARRFERVAEELYSLLPNDFIAARDEWIRFARESGDRKLATNLSALRKPTQAAWVVNALWRTHRGAVEELLDLAEPLREAQEQLEGEQLRRLSTTRRRLVNGLLEEARKHATEAGVRVSPDTLREAGDTLEAGLADPQVAARIRTGHMTQAASYAGFGPISSDTATARGSAKTTKSTKPKKKAGKADGEVDHQARRNQAAAQVAEAKATRTHARRELTEREKQIKAATTDRDSIHRDVEQLRRRLAGLEELLTKAEDTLAAIHEARDNAEAEHTHAEQTLAAAQDALHELDP